MRKFGRFAWSSRAVAGRPPVRRSTRRRAGPQDQRFTGTIMVLNAPVTGMAQVRITVERFTTDEDRKKLAEALAPGGTDALVRAMADMGSRVHPDRETTCGGPSAQPVMADGQGKEGPVRHRPADVLRRETERNSRSVDYPIGFIEMLLPPEGKGEGTLYVATQAQTGSDAASRCGRSVEHRAAEDHERRVRDRRAKKSKKK